MEDRGMVYTAKLPVGYSSGNIDPGELYRIRKENEEEIERIDKEAIKGNGILYRFIYEPIDIGIAVYQVIRVNRITCMVRYCSINGSQDVAEAWGNETCVGTNYIKRRLKAWSMALGFDANAMELEEQPHPEAEVAYQLGKQYLYIQTCDDGYDYNIYDESFQVIDGGIYNAGQPDIFEVVRMLISDSKHISGAEAFQINPKTLAEAAADVNAPLVEGIDPAVLARLIIGNAGDEIALKNICEAQAECIYELSEDDKEFLFETNGFYRSKEEYCYLHDEEPDFFDYLVREGLIVKTLDGYVFKNCV